MGADWFLDLTAFAAAATCSANDVSPESADLVRLIRRSKSSDVLDPDFFLNFAAFAAISSAREAPEGFTSFFASYTLS